MKIVCAHCSKESDKRPSDVNRAKKIGASLYCDRKCSSLGHRKHLTTEFLKERKRLYDAEYRATNLASITAKKAAYFKANYNPERAAIERKKTMQRHVEYCRQPEYKAWKKEYDRKYRAKKNYGEFWESFLILQEVQVEVEDRMPRYERMLQAGTLNKSQTRKRHENLNR